MEHRRTIRTIVVAGMLVFSLLTQDAFSQTRRRARTGATRPPAAGVDQDSTRRQPQKRPVDTSPLQPQDRAPTAEQVRDHFYRRMDARLKATQSLKNGWQVVYVTRKGSHLYAYVESGHVKDIAIGNSKLGSYLTRHAPKGITPEIVSGRQVDNTAATGGRQPEGGISGAVGGQPVAQQAPTNTGPSKAECGRRFFKCMAQAGGSLWEQIKAIGAALTLDLEGVEKYVDTSRARFERCMGTCMKYFQ